MALTGPRKVFFKRAQAPSSTQLRASKPNTKADTTSFITPYAFGAGDIRPQVQNVVFGNNGSDFFHSPEMFAPIVRASSSGSVGAGGAAPLRPSGVGGSLTIKGISAGSGAKDRLSKAVNDAAITKSHLKDVILNFSQREIAEIIFEAKAVWTVLAESRLQGQALFDYIRAMRVEWRGDALHLQLVGWEAASQEVGWAPTPGGMNAGLGKYDGTPKDMKPIYLNGRSHKVIAMRLEGTYADFASILMRQITERKVEPPKSGGVYDEQTNSWSFGGEKSRRLLKKTIDRQVKAAIALKPGEALRTADLEWRRDRTRPGKYDPDKDDNLPGNPFHKHSKSLLDGAIRSQSKMLREIKGRHTSNPMKEIVREPDGTFVVLRTMTDPTFLSNRVMRDRSIGPKKGRRRREGNRDLTRLAQNKWLSKGREPRDLIPLVLKIMQDSIIEKRIQKAAERLYTGFEDVMKNHIAIGVSGMVGDAMRRAWSSAATSQAKPRKK